MAFDNTNPARRDIVADRMAAMSRPQRELVVPEGLKGTLFSPRDLLEPALKASSDELQAYLTASRARHSRSPQVAPSPDTLQSGRSAA
jgi:hypothetical protein